MLERLLIEVLIVADKFLRWITYNELHLVLDGEEVRNYEKTT